MHPTSEEPGSWSPTQANPVATRHARLQSSASASASAQVTRYAVLSQAYADRGEARLAQLAVWAADVLVLQVLLWESGLGSAPDPDAQLTAVARAVGGSLAGYAHERHDLATVRESVERARDAMVATFDESVHTMLAQRFVGLDHLDDLPGPAAQDAQRSLDRRLAGREPGTLVADLHATAGDCMAVAEAMADEGDRDGAAHQVRQADLASFEAYLVTAALGVGDTTLATVDLRWDLAVAAAEDAASNAEDAEQVVHDFRDRLVALLGPAEEPGLRGFFEPFSFVRA